MSTIDKNDKITDIHVTVKVIYKFMVVILVYLFFCSTVYILAYSLMLENLTIPFT